MPLVVFVAFKLAITFVPPKVVPPTDEIVNAAVLMSAPPDSISVPPDVSETAFAVVIF